MNAAFVIDRMPLWAAGAGAVLLVLASVQAGLWVGARRRRDMEPGHEGPTGSGVAAILGLLGFILAFTFGMASSRYDVRRQLLLDDVNAIATAERRAELLPEPYRTESRALLLRYVELRLLATSDPRAIPQAIAESRAIEDRLWAGAVALARTDLNSDIGALYAEALNEVMAVHVTRATVALQYRIPTLVWQGLLLLTVISMAAVGFHFGTAGRASWIMKAGLALAFGAVLTLIAQLDRTVSGPLMIDQRPMENLHRRLVARTSTRADLADPTRAAPADSAPAAPAQRR